MSMSRNKVHTYTWGEGMPLQENLGFQAFQIVSDAILE